MLNIAHAPAQRQAPPAAAPRAISAPFLWICGVILPLIAIFLEANVAICANFIDPMPAPTYLIVLVAVPLCNALAWLGLRRDLFHRARWLAAMAGLVPPLPASTAC
jgi:hypothetical protein